jgi:hypothetical protein
MISVACNSRIPQAILQPGLLFKQIIIFQFMKHNSLADFTDKVTSKELFNITIKRITCVTLFGKVIVFPFVSVLMVECLHFAKSQKLDD